RARSPDCLDRSAHGRTGREPVVDEHDRPPGELESRTLTAVEQLARIELALLTPRQLVELLRSDAGGTNHVVVQHTHAAACDRAERELRLPRHAELAHEVDVERR